MQKTFEVSGPVELELRLAAFNPAPRDTATGPPHDRSMPGRYGRGAMAIVVGATNRGPMAGALLGSSTYQVVHRSTRPVLVVPTPE